MTVEKPQSNNQNSAHKLIVVPASDGVPGGTIRKLILVPEKAATTKGNGNKTRGVPLRSPELAGQTGGQSRKIVDTNPL